MHLIHNLESEQLFTQEMYRFAYRDGRSIADGGKTNEAANVSENLSVYVSPVRVATILSQQQLFFAPV